MAKKDTLNYDGSKFNCFNLTGAVGFGASNEKGDVTLIQAIFNFIFEGNPSILGIKENELPDLTGTFDSNTGFSIMKFQHKWMRILTAQKSGWLFPGNYKDKIPPMVGDEDRRQAMFLLHQFAEQAAAMLNETEYTVKMLEMFPELRAHIK